MPGTSDPGDERENGEDDVGEPGDQPGEEPGEEPGDEPGDISQEDRFLFALTNDPNYNQVLALRHKEDRLELVDSFSTDGQGLGALELPDLAEDDGIQPLKSEGALHRMQDYLLAVNAGSMSIAVFRVEQQDTGPQLTLIETQNIPGHPVSITSAGRRVFVAFSPGEAVTTEEPGTEQPGEEQPGTEQPGEEQPGEEQPGGEAVSGQGGIAQFRLGDDGMLNLDGPVLTLSTPTAHPSLALVVEHDDMDTDSWLVVTEVMNDVIDIWPIQSNGRVMVESRVENVSVGAGPFGADEFDDFLIVAESAPTMPNMGSVSTYRIEGEGTLTPVAESVASDQGGTCCVKVSENERFAYSLNTDSGTISSYELRDDGRVRLLEGIADTPANKPVDASLTEDGRFMYVLGDAGEIAIYEFEESGQLIPQGAFGEIGLPAQGAAGILAW